MSGLQGLLSWWFAPTQMRSGNSWQERSGELEGRLRQRAWVVLDLSALGEPQMMTSGEHVNIELQQQYSADLKGMRTHQLTRAWEGWGRSLFVEY